MGGNALKQTFTRRYSREEYYKLVPEVLDALKADFPKSRVEVVKSIRNKETFGDMDVLLEMDDNAGVLDLVSAFNPSELVHNGKIWSFDFKQLQIDVITCSPEEFETSTNYFAWNDLGNLIGKIAHKMGFKYGHKGLLYPVRIGTHLFDEIVVSRELDDILRFLGFDQPGANPKVFRDGFDELEDIFRYVAGSRYFDPAVYPLESLSHKARIRDRKRPTYNSFLKWVRDKHPGIDAHAVRDRELHLERARLTFKSFSDKLDEVQSNIEKNIVAKEKFNGLLVTQLTGLEGKKLGKFIADFKSKITEDNIQFKEHVLKIPKDELTELIKDFFKSR